MTNRRLSICDWWKIWWWRFEFGLNRLEESEIEMRGSKFVTAWVANVDWSLHSGATASNLRMTLLSLPSRAFTLPSCSPFIPAPSHFHPTFAATLTWRKTASSCAQFSVSFFFYFYFLGDLVSSPTPAERSIHDCYFVQKIMSFLLQIKFKKCSNTILRW